MKLIIDTIYNVRFNADNTLTGLINGVEMTLHKDKLVEHYGIDYQLIQLVRKYAEF